jgi:hypothetical protein
MNESRGDGPIERIFAKVQMHAQDLAAAFAIAAAGLMPRLYQTRLLKDDYGSIERDPNADRSRGAVLPFRPFADVREETPE